MSKESKTQSAGPAAETTAKPKKEVKWVNFITGTRSYKTHWLLAQLEQGEVPHRLSSHRCPAGNDIIQVEYGFLDFAYDAINVTTARIGTPQNHVEFSPLDLPDDHQFFKRDLDAMSLGTWQVSETVAESSLATESEPVTTTVQAPAPAPEAGDKPPVEAQQDTAETVEDDEDDWNLGDDEDEDDELAPDAEGDETENESLAYEHADEELSYADEEIYKVPAPVRMYEVDSSNVSHIGARPMKNEPAKLTFYIRFKQGHKLYRYNPVSIPTWHELLKLAVLKARGNQEASVGSAFHNLIRVPADADQLVCQRLDDNKWVKVLPKSERKKQSKERAEGTK